MLDAQAFRSVIKNTPLVSIDICMIHRGQILLAKRNNEPLKGRWFTPGGRIHKNETWQQALLRIVETELGISDIALTDFSLMGVWDHFYNISATAQKISTHYVNLPHYAELKFKPKITLDSQHKEYDWFDLAEVSDDNKYHPYMKNYASWIIQNIGDMNDIVEFDEIYKGIIR